MFTRLLFGTEGWMANADHLIGALTVISVAASEVAKPVRLLLVPLGAALFVTPFAFGAGTAATVFSLAAGLALVGLSFRRGPIRQHYGGGCD